MSTATVTATIEKLQSWITVDNLSKGLKKKRQLHADWNCDVPVPVASHCQYILGPVPWPGDVWNQSKTLIEEHYAEFKKADNFYAQEARNAKKLAKNPDAKVKIRPYTGKATTTRFLPVSTLSPLAFLQLH